MRLKSFLLILLIFILRAEYICAQLSMPEISSVSVHPVDSTIIIKWKTPDASQQVVAHGVSRLEYPGSTYPYTLIGSEHPIGINSFTDTDSRIIGYIHDQNSSRRYIYRVLARKSALESTLSHGHLTVKFRGSYNNCSNAFDLRWTPYKMIPIGSDSREITDESNAEYIKSDKFNKAVEYEVWGHQGPSLILPNATKLSNRITDTEILLKGLVVNSDYQLFIKCFLTSGDTATTHQISLNTNNRISPSVINIDTILSKGGNINVYIDLDRTAGLDTFAIFRSDITNKPIQWYYSKAEVPRFYTDSYGLSLGQVYSYKIASYRCGKIDDISDSAKNVLLYATPVNQNIRVQWTEVPNYTGSVDYSLERETTSGKNVLDVSHIMDYNFTDESASSLLCEGPQRIAYKLVADNGKTVSISETAHAKISPIISIPNAIDPLRSDIVSGTIMHCSVKTVARNEFGPIIDMNYDSYRVVLEIFNRAGIRIYGGIKDFGTNKDVFWRGQDTNGKLVPEGTYFYNTEVSFKTEGLEPFIRRGTVTVVR